MARVSRGTDPFLAIMCTRVWALFFFVLVAFLAGIPVASGCINNGINKHRVFTPGTNSCTITWRSPPAKPTSGFSIPVPKIWALGSAVAGDLDQDFDDLDLDDSQFEIYRMDRIRLAIQWAECLANDWPELDLQWCLADWHDGKLIPDNRAAVGETCWWMPWAGFSIDPKYATAVDESDTAKIPYVLRPLWWLSRGCYRAWTSRYNVVTLQP